MSKWAWLDEYLSSGVALLSRRTWLTLRTLMGKKQRDNKVNVCISVFVCARVCASQTYDVSFRSRMSVHTSHTLKKEKKDQNKLKHTSFLD